MATEDNFPTQAAPTSSKAAAVAPTKKPPHEWAIEKGYIVVTAEGKTNFAARTPWEFYGARQFARWADPEIDPTFVITEAEFDAAIAAVHVI